MERQTVSSRQNPLVKNVCGLADKKNRLQSGLFRFDGIKLLNEALSADVEIKYVICSESAVSKIKRLISDAVATGLIAGDCTVTVTDSVFEKLSDERSPEGVLTVAHMPRQLHRLADGELPQKRERILIAESLRDPGNLGTVIRSAYALGIDRLVLTDDCADIYNPRTLRAAMGAVFKLPTLTVESERLSEYIGRLRKDGRRVFATALSEDSKSIKELKLREGDCFVVGNEGHGLSDRVIHACDACVIIPMREGAESLNASAAAAICIWETVRA